MMQTTEKQGSGGRCTVVVCSCDAYCDCWQPFFRLLEKNWSCPYPILLMTEQTTEAPPSALPVRVFPAGEGAWTARLRRTLEAVQTDFVLLLLDDFFMTGPVDQARIDRCLSWLAQDAQAVCFSFFPTTGNALAEGGERYPGFERRPQTGLYRLNAQAGLWRRKRLLDFLQVDEDAWQWENAGNARSFSAPDAFYSAADEKPYVFPYDYMEHGLIGGRWFPATEQLFRENGIEMDLSRRGFYDPEKWALLPSVASAFCMDSALYLDRGHGFREQDTLRCSEQQAAVKRGAVLQEYRIERPARRTLRWDPSSRRGFALQALSVSAQDAGGRQFRLTPRGGNCRSADGCLVFLEDDPQLFLRLPLLARYPLTLTIRAQALCPLTEELLAACR